MAINNLDIRGYMMKLNAAPLSWIYMILTLMYEFMHGFAQKVVITLYIREFKSDLNAALLYWIYFYNGSYF